MPNEARVEQPDIPIPSVPVVIGFAAFFINLALLYYQRRGLGFPAVLAGLSFLFVTAHILGNAALGALVPDALWRAVARIAYFLLTALAVILLPATQPSVLGLLFTLSAGSITILWLWRGGLQPLYGPPLTATLLVLGVGLVALAGLQYYEEQTHFLMPEFLDLGLLHKDPLGFIAFAATIANGEAPGGVMDGVQPLPYHFGAMYFIAALAGSSNSSLVMGQVAAHQLIFLPLIFFHVGLGTAGIKPDRSRTSFAVPIALALMFLLPSAWWPVVFYSESSAAGLPALFLFLTFFHAWYAPETLNRTRWAALLIVTPFLALCLFIKVPTGFMLFALASYLAAELLTGRRTWMAVGLYAIGCFALIAFALAKVWAAQGPFPTAGQMLTTANLPVVLRETALAGLVVAAAVVARQSLLYRLAPSTRHPLGLDRISRGYLLWFAGAVAGGIVIAVINFPYNARYLFNTLSIAAIPILALSLAVPFGRLAEGSPVRGWAAATFLVLAILVLAEQTRLEPSAASRRSADANRMICAAVDRSCPVGQRIFDVPRPPDLATLIDDSPGSRLVEQARLLADRGAEAFFVPHDAEAVWQFLLSRRRPSDNLQLLPAHLGRPMVLGLPPIRFNVDLVTINASVPGTYDDRNRSRPITDEELCHHAATLGIGRLAVIADLAAKRRNRLLDCALLPPTS